MTDQPSILVPSLSQPPFSSLRRFVRPRDAAAERCELCSAPLPPDHAHLVEPATRRLLCACDACALLFSSPHATRFRRIPRQTRFLPQLRMTDARWDELRLPINLAFFFHSTPAGKVVALYPSPAGQVESLLPLDAWRDLAGPNPALLTLEPDVEALLVNRLGPGRGFATHEYYLAPIDRCYALVGVVRAHWRGLSGGADAWHAVRDFFRQLRRHAHPIPEEANA